MSGCWVVRVDEPCEPETGFAARAAFLAGAAAQGYPCALPLQSPIINQPSTSPPVVKGEGGGKGQKRPRKNRKSQGRFPAYNLSQIDEWIAYCAAEQDESVRVQMYERLCCMLMRLGPMMSTRPAPNCRCSMCTKYCSWLIQEAGLMGYETRVVRGHEAHIYPVSNAHV